MTHHDLLEAVWVYCNSRPDCRIFPNRTGVAKYKDKKTKKTYVVPYGLTKSGSSDLIGFATKTITPDMVGQKIGVFLAIEIKAGDDTVKPDQQNFIDRCRKYGCIAGAVRSVAEVEKLLPKTP